MERKITINKSDSKDEEVGIRIIIDNPPGYMDKIHHIKISRASLRDIIKEFRRPTLWEKILELLK